MSVTDALDLIVRVFFVALGIMAIADFVRHRDAIRRDVALLFCLLAVPFLIQLIALTNGQNVEDVSGLAESIAILGLILEPYLILRLVRYLRSMPDYMLRWALYSMLATIVIGSIFGPRIPIISVVVSQSYLIGFNLYAMVGFVRGALRATGVARQRLRFAAAGSGLFALTFIAALLAVAIPRQEDAVFSLVQVLAAACALAFYVGFIPPRWLRRVWQLSELRNYLLAATHNLPADGTGVAKSLGRLCQSANRAVDGMAAGVIQWDETTGTWELREDTDHETLLSALTNGQQVIKQALQAHEASFIYVPDVKDENERKQLATVDGGTWLFVPMNVNDRLWGMLLVLLRGRSLFIEDDLSLLELMAQENAVILTNYGLIIELQGYSEQLERKVEERTAALNESEKRYRKLNTELEERVRVRTEELEAGHTFLRTLVDNIPDAIYSKDTQGHFLFNNIAHARLIGVHDPKELVGKHDVDFFPAELAAHYADDEQQVIASGEALIQKEEPSTVADGQAIWVSTTKVPLRNRLGEIIGTVGITRDMTEHKQAEDKIKELNHTLEAANKELEAFTYSVSHDLRAPLRAIDGFAQALAQKFPMEADPEALRYIERVRSNASRMGMLIDDLLTLSRTSRQPLKKQKIDPTSVVRQALEYLRVEQEGRQVKIQIGELPVCEADPALLTQVFANLLSNALKYSSKREVAHIEVGCQQTNGSSVFFVKDNGAGFDMQYAGKLFGVFQRLHSMTDYPGTGVGLAIVQRVVRRHGGDVWAEAQLENGATFYFTLGEAQQ